MAARSRPARHINLLRGWPGPPLLPTQQIAESTARAMAKPEVSLPALEYGADLGFTPLRHSVASWLSNHYRVHPPDPERICISGGASQGIACILQCFTDPIVTKAVWLVAPAYYLACPIFEDAGFAGRLRAVPEDSEGVDVEWLESKMRDMGDINAKDQPDPFKPFKPADPLRKLYRHVIYCVPSSSNPSGKTMSLGRREDLVRLARKHDALVICDDVYDMLQWNVVPNSSTSSSPPAGETPFPESRRLPRLVDVDLSLGPPSSTIPSTSRWFGNAISNGSFSKLVSPGMRTGWVESTPAFALGVSRTGSTRSGGAPSQLCAAVIDDMLSTGILDKLISDVVRPALQHKHSVLLGTVTSMQSRGVAWELVDGNPVTYGGYFMWIALPPGISAAAVANIAHDDENLTVSPGNMFQVLGDEAAAEFDSHVRLCFSWEDEAGIREGAERLAKVVLQLTPKTVTS
ncbi:PLP-dependent transferase [Zalerion maritima]|uniref:PLP-dependent transferase n=1 Tax=Zalerion maritima TaxID=339359 RepID=A0AAD5WRX5_9PEZI|nr:PLP-dependent transferase [Zalerion maritima]